jgi:arsenate reductase
MPNIFICYPTCTTCQKARAWLQARNISFEERHIMNDRPSAQEIVEWINHSGLPVQKFFNTSGMLYRDMGLKDKLTSMTDNEKIALLATDGMLVKRPVFLSNTTVLVGFREKEWEQALL